MKRRLVPALVLPLLVAAGLLAAAAPAQACRCATPSWEQLETSADAVFVATIGSSRSAPAAGPFDERRWDAYVDAVYQGVVPARTAVVAGTSEASCGYKLVPGERYVVVTTGGGARPWTTSLCSGTERVGDGVLNHVERVLGPPYPPRGPISAPGPIAYGGPGTVAPEHAATAAVRDALALLLAPALGPADA